MAELMIRITIRGDEAEVEATRSRVEDALSDAAATRKIGYTMVPDERWIDDAETLSKIVEVLWPMGDTEKQWSPDDFDSIAAVLNTRFPRIMERRRIVSLLDRLVHAGRRSPLTDELLAEVEWAKVEIGRIVR